MALLSIAWAAYSSQVAWERALPREDEAFRLRLAWWERERAKEGQPEPAPAAATGWWDITETMNRLSLCLFSLGLVALIVFCIGNYNGGVRVSQHPPEN